MGISDGAPPISRGLAGRMVYVGLWTQGIACGSALGWALPARWAGRLRTGGDAPLGAVSAAFRGRPLRSEGRLPRFAGRLLLNEGEVVPFVGEVIPL